MYPGVHAVTAPNRPAVIMADSGRCLTYAELEERSRRLAHVLREAGLRKGDVVALLTDNSIHAYEVYWAAMRSGLYLTAVNNHLTAAEISYILNDSSAAALLVSATLDELVQELRADIPGVRKRVAFGGPVAGFEEYEPVLAAASDDPLVDQPKGADLLYSSGTTGRPKGIRPELPDSQIDEPTDQLGEALELMYGFGPEMVYLSPAPVYHAAPLRFSARVHVVGGTVVMMERFDAEKALDAIDRYQVTHSQWVPTMFIRMLKLPESVRGHYDLSSHRVAIHAAAPCPVEVKRAMIDWWGPVLTEYYASTEGTGMTFIDSEQWMAKPGSVGKAVLGTLRICDADGTELSAGEVGTIYFQRDELAFEYLGAPEKTREVWHPSIPNCATVGDLGYVDADGYLFLTDRKAFMIISGGVNIYPQEVEDTLALHPSIVDVAVIGVPDAEMGESVKAVVQPASATRPGPELEAELLDHVRGRIAHYKAPRSIDFIDELPRTPTGKLVKGPLKARYTAQDSA